MNAISQSRLRRGQTDAAIVAALRKIKDDYSIVQAGPDWVTIQPWRFGAPDRTGIGKLRARAESAGLNAVVEEHAVRVTLPC